MVVMAYWRMAGCTLSRIALGYERPCDVIQRSVGDRLPVCVGYTSGSREPAYRCVSAAWQPGGLLLNWRSKGTATWIVNS